MQPITLRGKSETASDLDFLKFLLVLNDVGVALRLKYAHFHKVHPVISSFTDKDAERKVIQFAICVLQIASYERSTTVTNILLILLANFYSTGVKDT